ncbi:MAG TPA: hypothetical protein VF412_02615 [Bdellovibrio sp.]|uniref:hypothetical protein n=1 Tax=Bdellovibrio sp. TaxID=28201 RepID=UPI002F1CB940
MKLFLVAGALLLAQSSWAAPSLRVVSLDCSAVNTLGYASLKLNKSDQVSITVNSAYSSLAAIKSVGESSILLEQVEPQQQYRLEFSEPLKVGAQKVSGGLYFKYTPHSPFVLASYASCQVELAEVAP